MDTKYQYKQPETKDDLVEVIVPSGNVFLFHRPSRFSMLFHLGKLPEAAASEALAAWQKSGDVEAEEDIAPQTQNQKQLARAAFQLRDKVLELSHTPKLVVGPAKENELSTDDVADVDLAYLFKWVSAGGDMAIMAATFPLGRQPGPMASSNRKTRRTAAKQASRAN
jgi:hypothetical protein